jgi:hypothetical protein
LPGTTLAVAAPAGAPRDTSPEVIVIGRGGAARIFSLFAWNFARHPPEQKKYSLPLCSVLWRAVSGFTSMPQTGSFCRMGNDAEFGVSNGSKCSISGSRIALGGIVPLLDTRH